jgi:hypothetical protein
MLLTDWRDATASGPPNRGAQSSAHNIPLEACAPYVRIETASLTAAASAEEAAGECVDAWHFLSGAALIHWISWARYMVPPGRPS